jgi:3-oxoacyl-[acyl-carrier protein] reductase
VSNAGIGTATELARTTTEEWDRHMAVNVRPSFLLARELAPGMSERGFGRMLFLSSIAAYTGGVVGPAYATSKAALLGLMHSLAATLAPHGVTANAIAPAFVEDTGLLPEDPARRRELAERIPLGRLGRPEEIARAGVAMLANGYVTGQTLVIAGGMYPR